VATDALYESMAQNEPRTRADNGHPRANLAENMEEKEEAGFRSRT